MAIRCTSGAATRSIFGISMETGPAYFVVDAKPGDGEIAVSASGDQFTLRGG